jgi:hypothetical protein
MPCYTAHVFRRSSAVEQLTVNQLVVGSIPTAGAKKFPQISVFKRYLRSLTQKMLITPDFVNIFINISDNSKMLPPLGYGYTRWVSAGVRMLWRGFSGKAARFVYSLPSRYVWM